MQEIIITTTNTKYKKWWTRYIECSLKQWIGFYDWFHIQAPTLNTLVMFYWGLWLIWRMMDSCARRQTRDGPSEVYCFSRETMEKALKKKYINSHGLQWETQFVTNLSLYAQTNWHFDVFWEWELSPEMDFLKGWRIMTRENSRYIEIPRACTCIGRMKKVVTQKIDRMMHYEDRFSQQIKPYKH